MCLASTKAQTVLFCFPRDPVCKFVVLWSFVNLSVKQLIVFTEQTSLNTQCTRSTLFYLVCRSKNRTSQVLRAYCHWLRYAGGDTDQRLETKCAKITHLNLSLNSSKHIKNHRTVTHQIKLSLHNFDFFTKLIEIPETPTKNNKSMLMYLSIISRLQF